MKKYRVIEWATGVVGTAALKRIIEHPELELAGVKVYSDDKTGRDAGERRGRRSPRRVRGVDHPAQSPPRCTLQ